MNSKEALVVIIMGSKRDLSHVQKITEVLDRFAIAYELRVASAHKATAYLLDMLSEYEESDRRIVYIAVAGRSNALAGVIDANVSGPVITCPPISTAFGGADIYSSLRMPSWVGPMVVLEPGAAALAAIKCLALADPDLRRRVVAFQRDISNQITEDDQEVSKNLAGETKKEI